MSNNWQLSAVILYFIAMLAIGLWASHKNKNLDDYMLAGRRMKPSVAALSAGASDLSGWLVMGLPGAIMLTGLVEMWMVIGLVIGCWLNWKIVAPRLRVYTEVAKNSITIPSFLENRFKDRTHILRVACGIIILVFFTFYVSSGMVSGGKFFESAFGSTYIWGMLLVAVITVIYTLFGGFLGASLTDVVQGLLMFAALVAVPIVCIFVMGGWGELVDSLRSANSTVEGANYLNLFANVTWIGVISSVAWGLGYFGQPHIIVRFMSMRSEKEAHIGRRIGVSWMAICCLGAVMTAITGVAYMQANPGLALNDPETVFLVMADILFHPFVAGLVLAAVLAAIMSTVSSQLIVCSSALVEDLYKMVGKEKAPHQMVWLGRIGVVVVSIAAALLAMNPESSVLELVSFAWAGFGSAFGPVIILALFWRKYTNWGALTSVVGGAAIAVIWYLLPSDALGGLGALYELVPGFLLGVIGGWIVSKLTYDPTTEDAQAVNAEFDEFQTRVIASKHRYEKISA